MKKKQFIPEGWTLKEIAGVRQLDGGEGIPQEALQQTGGGIQILNCRAKIEGMRGRG